MRLPKKFTDRVQKTGKKYQEITHAAAIKDVSEADTVTIVKDVLSDIFGYDKYAELTGEHQIRGTFCDLAINLNNKLSFLIEVKSAGSKLSQAHLRQVVNYAANQGVQWVALTNAVRWHVYRIEFAQPISYKEVACIDFLDINFRNDDDLQKLFILSREGLTSSAIEEYYSHIQVINKYTLAQILLSDPLLSVVRREIRKIFAGVKVDESKILQMFQNDVIKRELLEGDEMKDALSRIKKGTAKSKKTKTSGNKTDNDGPVENT